jgi:hypothetical protein
MASHKMVSVGTTPVLLSPPGVHGDIDMAIQSQSGTGSVFVGAQNVSPSNFGSRIFPYSVYSVTLSGSEEVWAVSQGAVVVSVLITTK